MIIHVDDGLGFAKDKPTALRVKQLLEKHFELTWEMPEIGVEFEFIGY